MEEYDVIVIGSGPGGYVAAEYAALNKLKTLCIEAKAYGGVCLNQGCIPTKALLQTAKHYSEWQNLGDFGVISNSPTLDWTKALQRKNQVVQRLQKGVLGLLKQAKAHTIQGYVETVTPTCVVVNGQQIAYKYLVLATGSFPRKLLLAGFEQGYASGHIINSDEALNLTTLPKRLCIVGGGVIGVEFAFLYACLGVEVVLLQGVERILETLDGDLAATIHQVLLAKKVKIITNVQIQAYTNNCLQYQHQNQTYFQEADYFLVSIGRSANITLAQQLNLNLNANKAIATNEYMQTSQPNVYAIGDCVGQVMLAHSAYHNAVVAIEHILQTNPRKMIWQQVPSCIYTTPEAATVGYSEDQLKNQNIPYYKVKIPYAHIGKALCSGNVMGFCKLLVSPDYGEILGCQIVGEHADDLICIIAAAMQSEASVVTLAQTIHPHPTLGEIIWEAAKKMVGLYFAKQQFC